MIIWIDVFLFTCAVVFVIAGIMQIKHSKQPERDALDTFTNRRNAVSCICLAILFVTIVLCINL